MRLHINSTYRDNETKQYIQIDGGKKTDKLTVYHVTGSCVINSEVELHSVTSRLLLITYFVYL